MKFIDKLLGKKPNNRDDIKEMIDTLLEHKLLLNERGVSMAMMLKERGANYYELVGLLIAHCMATDIAGFEEGKIEPALAMTRFTIHYSLAKFVLDQREQHHSFRDDIFHMIMSCTAPKKHSVKVDAAKDLCRQAGRERTVEWIGDLA